MGRGHQYDGWELVLNQLPFADTARASGDAPPVALLVAELDAIARLWPAGSPAPFDNSGAAPFGSISEDLQARWPQLGRRLAVRLATADLLSHCDSRWDPETSPDPWPGMLAAAKTARDQLLAKAAVTDALFDVLDAAADAAPIAEAIDQLRPRLDELRAVIELQGHRTWRSAQDTISHHLTALAVDESGTPIAGKFDHGAAEGDILRSLADALPRPSEPRTWAIWIATRAGPSGSEEAWTAEVNGPIATSGITCSGDMASWIQAVKAEITAAYVKAERPVPPDVCAFGEGSDFEDGVELWSFARTPASFLSRVEVVATTEDEAIELASNALRATFALHDPWVAGDLLSDVVLWTSPSGWRRPRASARSLGEGEIFAARAAGRAVRHYAGDLGSPLDRERLEVLRSRALVRDPRASLEVRLMRAWTELERLKPRPSPLVDVAGWLWLRTAYDEAASMIYALFNRLHDRLQWEHLRADATPEAFRQAVKAAAAKTYPGLLPALEANRTALDLVHPDTLTAALQQQVDRALSCPHRLAQRRAVHKLAYRRALRHRNLVTHGHRLPDAVLAPTTAFLARQLDLAVSADDAHARGTGSRWMGSLQQAPYGRWHRETLTALLTEVETRHARRRRPS